MSHNLVVYQFSRSEVERGDFSHFLNVYSPVPPAAGRSGVDVAHASRVCVLQCAHCHLSLDNIRPVRGCQPSTPGNLSMLSYLRRPAVPGANRANLRPAAGRIFITSEITLGISIY